MYIHTAALASAAERLGFATRNMALCIFGVVFALWFVCMMIV
jgi:hypothetical protein